MNLKSILDELILIRSNLRSIDIRDSIKNTKSAIILEKIIHENNMITSIISNALSTKYSKPKDFESVKNFDILKKFDVYTIVGVGCNPTELKTAIVKKLNTVNIKKWYYFTGSEYNNFYKLSNNNKYQEGLIFVAFSYDYKDKNKLIQFKKDQNEYHIWYHELLKRNRRNQNEKNFNKI